MNFRIIKQDAKCRDLVGSTILLKTGRKKLFEIYIIYNTIYYQGSTTSKILPLSAGTLVSPLNETSLGYCS